jgi:signal transduction histidine kinase/ActR/RegA family two-component response regulator
MRSRVGAGTLGERVLVLPPTAKDARLSRSLLSEAGLVAEVCPDLSALSRALDEGAGAILLTEEALVADDLHLLRRKLGDQPEWSDVPIILLTGSATDSRVTVEAMEMQGNVTMLERPVRLNMLVSVLWTAVQARRRQYELRDRIAELQRAQEALREADRRKDEFLATLAHELRNPLAPLRNALELMKQARADSKQMDNARAMMERQVRQMVRLVEDLLDVSRITRNKLELRTRRLDLRSVIEHAVEASRPLFDQAGHTLTVTLPDDPVFLDGDPVRLAQVLGNLLTNACKYTEAGGHVWLTVARSGSEVAVSVRDSGVGIPPEMLPRVFDLFTQVDRSLERSWGGLGIGLSLVKRLVEMHAGTVTARSDGHGRGSDFEIRLPVSSGDGPVTRPASRAEVESPKAPPHRILVVDDNPDSAESLARLLQHAGNETQVAQDGMEAIERAAAFRPDVILLDIGLPKLNGYDACRRIREQPWGKDMVLVALTGWGQEDDRRRSRDVGFDHHLVKPVEPGDLMKLLSLLRADPVEHPAAPPGLTESIALRPGPDPS